ncbi:MAG: nuclear transport factor 2 family protein [bacterium]|nr:nuclear transport factor 2 family protein [bacterium]
MIKIGLTLTTAVLALSMIGLKAPDDDHKAVKRAVQDYVEGFYEAKPELIERGVHTDLTKYGFWRRTAEEKYTGTAMTFDMAIEFAKKWNADGKQGTDLTYDIQLLDVADQTAAAKLTAKWGIDYMHLAKNDKGEWKIHHVMWQSMVKDDAD